MLFILTPIEGGPPSVDGILEPGSGHAEALVHQSIFVCLWAESGVLEKSLELFEVLVGDMDFEGLEDSFRGRGEPTEPHGLKLVIHCCSTWRRGNHKCVRYLAVGWSEVETPSNVGIGIPTGIYSGLCHASPTASWLSLHDLMNESFALVMDNPGELLFSTSQ